ncbi:MAG TPA: tetratricopeptide repeat protein [Allosphingosinicella sp.]
MNVANPSRLERLMPLLESDPSNLSLIADAAESALDERRPEQALELLDRYGAIAPLPPRESNLRGLAAMQLQRFDEAAVVFESLADGGDPGARFNLAWSRAMLNDADGALALLDEDLAHALPQAAMLKVQLLHSGGEFDVAADLARVYVERHPDHRGLLAAVSVLALDIEDGELAARCAAAAGDHPDAQTTLGTLALREDRGGEARDLFDRALARNAAVPRAWVGRGLARLMSGEADGAAADIDKGAEMFGDHLGSWIAAGWAHFVNRDLAAARARFETALGLDATFAEAHGALAVLDLVEGRIEEAKRGCEVALRLDRECYSGALARALLAARSGDAAAAQRIFEAALTVPVDRSGRTIAQAMAKSGL